MRNSKAYINTIVQIVGFFWFLFFLECSTIFAKDVVVVGTGGKGEGRRGGGGGRERLYAPEVVAGFTFNPASYYGASQVTFSEQTVNKHELVVKLTLVLLCQDSISHIQDPSNSYMKAQPPRAIVIRY